MEPAPAAFTNAGWPKGIDWQSELRPHYATAKRMLGATEAPQDGRTDHLLKELAGERPRTGLVYKAVDVGVFFGDPDRAVPDPYFGGEGPVRQGCRFCGGCMVGCRYGAKNSLDKNYLHLAERRGAEVFPSTEASFIEPEGESYAVHCKTGDGLVRRRRTFRARRVIVAAGVLGTLRLLFRSRDSRRTLPKVSASLGTSVRTNDEAFYGVRTEDHAADFSQGLAISSSLELDERTKMEIVRYPKGSDAMGLLASPLFTEPTFRLRLLEFLREFVRRPLDVIRLLNPIGFATKTIILMSMQSTDGMMHLGWRRRLGIFGKRLAQVSKDLRRPTVIIPRSEKIARTLAQKIGGEPGSTWTALFGMSFTAHILGGCPIGSGPGEGVVDASHQVFGHEGLYVLGGATVPANLGVNPSLTITAMAERAMAAFPPPL